MRGLEGLLAMLAPFPIPVIRHDRRPILDPHASRPAVRLNPGSPLRIGRDDC
jgi:hypothetical protein